MAGDWTPFRHDLIDDPAVMRMSSILNIPRQHVIGCLYCVWTWFDRHTVDGNAVGVTEVEIDALAAHGSFARAMQSVSWLVVNSDGCTIPNFSRWMSKNAKKRAKTAKRVETHRKRKCNAGVTPAALPQNRTEQYSTVQERRVIQNRTEAALSASGASLSSGAGLDCSALDSERARRDERAKAIARIADGALDRAFLREIASSTFSLETLSECMKVVHATPNLRKPGALLRSLLEERGFVSVRRNGRHE